MKIFLHGSSVYSYHLFLISSASVRLLPFLSFIVPIFAWNVPLVSSDTSWCHLMRRSDSLEKTVMLGKIEGRRRSGWQKMRQLDGITGSMDMGLSKLRELAQTHVHRVGDAIHPSHPLSSPSPPAFNLSQHHGLLQGVSSSHQVAKVLEFQLQHQSFQWIFRTDFL